MKLAPTSLATLVTALAIVALLCVPQSILPTHTDISSANPRRPIMTIQPPVLAGALSPAVGQSRSATAFISVSVTDRFLHVHNHYVDPATHNATLDLTPYLVPGWSLYRVEMDVDNLTAALEREVTGGSTTTFGNTFRIYNDTAVSLVFDSLAQGFFSDQPFDGALINYSVYYRTPSYTPALQGNAYFVVRSDYSDTTTNVTDFLPVPYSGTPRWANITCTGEALNASTSYYALIDGGSLHNDDLGNFPDILWAYYSTTDYQFISKRHIRDTGWGTISLDAHMWYAYIPWNRTTNAPLVFGNPQTIALTANGTALTSPSKFVFVDNTKNITQIVFQSNQSVYIYHNLTLWYKRDATASTVWNIPSAGANVEWNATVSVVYPVTTGITGRYLNFTVMSDWDATGIYESTSPTTNHTSFEQYGTTVMASEMSGGTWTLTSSAPNYVTDIDLPSVLSILDSPTITNHIEGASADPAQTGTTNLTVWHGGGRVWSPANETVVNGVTTYVWDINYNNTDNGVFTIETYWANGTEAGYLSVEVSVYYPTTLTAAESEINAYTDSSFDISVYFNDTFTPKGLNGTWASVVYSLDGGGNVPMTDQGDGTWTSTISTAGLSPGVHQVTVYGTGHYLENQSTVITVHLVHDTLPLGITFTSGNDITYLQHTTLLVNYSLANGTSVSDAWVNVTIGTNTWDLTWNMTSQLYEIRFNGSDIPPGFGDHSLYVNAWKSGYEAQSDNTHSLILREEPTALTVQWSAGNDITYIERTVLQVRYTLLDDAPITDATVNMTIDGTTYDLTWNATSGFYEFEFVGSSSWPGFGFWNLNVSAWKPNYVSQYDDTQTLHVREDPTTVQVSWTNSVIDWTQSVILRVNYTDSHGHPITGATQRDVVVNGTLYTLAPSGSSYLIEFNNSFDIGYHIVYVNLSKYGYTYGERSGITFTIQEAPTTLSVFWGPANVTIDYTQSLNLTVDYVYQGGGDVPASATVNVTIDGHVYDLTYSGTEWVVSIPGSDVGIGIFTATIHAWLYGYEAQSNVTNNLNVTLAPNSFIVTWEPSSLNATYVQTLNVSVIYTHDYDPIVGATVRLIIDDTRTYDFVYNSTTERWHLSIQADEIGIGVRNITVRANKTGYDTGVEKSILRVNIDQSQVTTSWTTETLYYTHQTTLEVTVRDSFGRPMNDALVNVTYRGTEYSLNSNGVGVYSLLLNGSDGMGVCPITVNTFRYGMTNHTLGLTLTIAETPTTLTVDTTVLAYNGSQIEILYHDGSIRVRATAEDVDSNRLNGMTVNLTVGGAVYDLTLEANGVYSVEIDAEALGVGEHLLTVRADAYGYTGVVHEYGVTVLPIPTHVVSSQPIPETIVLNWTIDIVFEFIDDHTGARLAPASVDITWDKTLNVTEIESGRFQVTIDTFALSIGNHAFSVVFSLENYSSASVSQTVNVRAAFTTISAPARYTVPENETRTFTVTYFDVDHNVPIDWASVVVQIGTNQYEMKYTGGGTYAASIWLQLSPGEYVITYAAEATGCHSNTTTSVLVITEKYAVTIEPDLPTSATEGSAITLGATIRRADTGDPLAGVILTFTVVSRMDNDTILTDTLSDTTNPEGYASQAFLVPMDVTNITVTITYAGSDQYWSAHAESQTIPVQKSFFPPLSPEVQFLLRLAALPLVLLSVGYVVYAKKHKPKKLRRQEEIATQLQRFYDLASLRHFMAVYKNRGTCVFYYPFTEERIQPDLISGFITAVTTVYGEITGEGGEGALEEIQYKGLLLNAYSGKHIVGILIIEGETTPFLKERLRFFVDMFEGQFESILSDWNGCVDCFDAEWIVNNLHGAFEYDMVLPHRLDTSKRVKGIDAKIIKVIRGHLDERGEFRLRDVLDDVAEAIGRSKEEALERLLRLRDSHVLVPISVSTVLTRQGLGIPGSEKNETGEPAVETGEEAHEDDADTVAPKEEKIESEIHDAEKFVQEVERLLSEKNKDNNTDDDE
ncbi:MAG: hypothetical protein ACTSUH_01125 [Candidatus Thorarchaeota archaeon]